MTLRLCVIMLFFKTLQIVSFCAGVQSGYTFVHQIIRDYFTEYYSPHDPPYARSALKPFRAILRLSPLSR